MRDMERRTALAYAAAAAGTVLAGSTALAATTGVLGGNDPDPVEIEDISTSADDLETTTSTTLPEPTVMTVVVDEFVTAPAPASATSVDDNGGLRPAGVSDDSPDAYDDNGGDRPDGVSDDVYDDHDDDDDQDEDDEYEDDEYENDHDEDELEDESDDD